MEYGNGVERTLGKILATQELILKQIETQTEKNTDLDERVKKIEIRMSYVAGWAIAIVTGLTLMSDVLLTKIGFK